MTTLPSEQDAILPGTGPGQPLTPATGANASAGATPQPATDTSAIGSWWNGLWSGIVGAGAGAPQLGALGAGGIGWADIGAGIESAFVAFFTDLFKAIVGPLEILLGALLIIIAIVLIFKDEITSVAPLVAAAAL